MPYVLRVNSCAHQSVIRHVAIIRNDVELADDAWVVDVHGISCNVILRGLKHGQLASSYLDVAGGLRNNT